jgi:hypothetical protein
LQRSLNGSNGKNGQLHVRKLGRPTLRTSRIEKVILGRISEGRSLQKVCRSKHLPSYSTVTRWLNDDEEFRKKYAQSRKQQAELLASQILEIADDEEQDTAQDRINRARLKIDTRKWIASKLLPKVYGERNNPEITVNSTVNNILVMNQDQMKRLQERNQEALMR